MLHMRHSNQSGFTIVELIVTTFVMFIVVVIFGGIISASYRQAIAADALASMTRDMHVTMDAIEMDVLATVGEYSCAYSANLEIFWRRW